MAMISAPQMIYASRMYGTDIISYLQHKYITRHKPYIISHSDISLLIATNYAIISSKEGAFMAENKLLALSFDFAVVIVNLADNVNC